MRVNSQDVEQEIYEKRREVRYDIRDMTVEMIVDKFEDGLDDCKQSNKYNYIYIPEYQRDFVWDESRQSKLIESIIMGLPIPFIFVAENSDSSWEIVDGSQRIRTLHAFVKGELKLKNLEVIKGLNGYMFSDLERSRQGKILSTALRIIVLSEETSDDVKTDMFERINRGSDLLKPMETRRGSTKGLFSDFIEEYCTKDDFIQCTPIAKNMEKRREREELLLRFYALSRTKKYEVGIKEGISRFLDDYYKKTNEEWNAMNKEGLERVKKDYESQMDEVVEYVKRFFPYGFRHRHNPQTKRAVFEAISLGVWMAIDRNNIRESIDVHDIEAVLESPEFNELVQGATETHGKRRLYGRIKLIYNVVGEGADAKDSE